MEKMRGNHANGSCHEQGGDGGAGNIAAKVGVRAAGAVCVKSGKEGGRRGAAYEKIGIATAVTTRTKMAFIS